MVLQPLEFNVPIYNPFAVTNCPTFDLSILQSHPCHEGHGGTQLASDHLRSSSERRLGGPQNRIDGPLSVGNQEYWVLEAFFG